MGVTYNLILGGGASLPTTLNVTVSGGTATTVTASLGSRSVSLAYDSTSALWSAALPKNATGNWTVTATGGSKTVSDLVAISGPGIWSMELALGPLPSGYTQLEYIESTGTQYIDAGVSNVNGAVITFQYTSITNNTSVFGARNTEGGSSRFGLTIFNGGWHFMPPGISYGVADTSKHTVQMGSIASWKSILDDTEYGTATRDYSSISTYLFAEHFYTRGVLLLAALRIFEAKLYQDAPLVRDFIPARRNSDSAVGMYDTVTQTFYTNAGSGTFIAGPDV